MLYKNQGKHIQIKCTYTVLWMQNDILVIIYGSYSKEVTRFLLPIVSPAPYLPIFSLFQFCIFDFVVISLPIFTP